MLGAVLGLMLSVVPSGASSFVEDLCTTRALTLVETGDRPYHAWLPPIACGSAPPRSLPLLVVLSCYGCDAHTVPSGGLLVWAEAYSFVVIAGESLSRSWNAGECCGSSLANHVDDSGYIARILKHALGLLTVANPQALFAFGWSNGGFLATQLAHTSSIFAGVSAAAGYRYAFIDLSGARPNATLSKPTPILLHHATDDRAVSYEGCCYGPHSNRCCCEIDQRSRVCIRAPMAFDAWANANGCEESYVVIAHLHGKVLCRTAQRCRANTTLCTFSRAGHFSRPRFRLPLAGETMNFFADKACALGGGTWNGRSCICPTPGATRPYCLEGAVGPIVAFGVLIFPPRAP